MLLFSSLLVAMALVPVQVVSMLNIPHQLPSENAAEVVLKYATSSTYMVNV